MSRDRKDVLSANVSPLSPRCSEAGANEWAEDGCDAPASGIVLQLSIALARQAAQEDDAAEQRKD
jgi:hypothetical protein